MLKAGQKVQIIDTRPRHYTDARAMAAELVRMPVEVIVTDGGDKVTQFAYEATRKIPMG